MDAVKNTLFPGAGGTDSAAADGVPWWMKYVAKALAILSAVGNDVARSTSLTLTLCCTLPVRSLHDVH